MRHSGEKVTKGEKMKRQYLVTWSIDIEEASNPEEAAKEAYEIMVNAKENAPFFDVTDSVSGKMYDIDITTFEQVKNKT
jgi:hypothetical protein